MTYRNNDIDKMTEAHIIGKRHWKSTESAAGLRAKFSCLMQSKSKSIGTKCLKTWSPLKTADCSSEVLISLGFV